MDGCMRWFARVERVEGQEGEKLTLSVVDFWESGVTFSLI